MRKIKPDHAQLEDAGKNLLVLCSTEIPNYEDQNAFALRRDDNFRRYMKSMRKENIDNFVIPFSTGCPPSQTLLSVLCSDLDPSKNIEKIIEVVEAGADVNLRRLDCYRETPIMSAAGNGALNVVRFLFEQGADLSIVDKFGKSIFSWSTVDVAVELEKMICLEHSRVKSLQSMAYNTLYENEKNDWGKWKNLKNSLPQVVLLR